MNLISSENKGANYTGSLLNSHQRIKCLCLLECSVHRNSNKCCRIFQPINHLNLIFFHWEKHFLFHSSKDLLTEEAHLESSYFHWVKEYTNCAHTPRLPVFLMYFIIVGESHFLPRIRVQTVQALFSISTKESSVYVCRSAKYIKTVTNAVEFSGQSITSRGVDNILPPP